MSDNIRSVGPGAGFSEVYQKLKSDVSFFEDGEHVRGYGEQLYVRSGWDRLTASDPERQERWQAGADYVRAAIDREYGLGLGDAIFSSLSRSAGHRLHNEVTRGDLEQINDLLGKRSATWQSVTGGTYKGTAERAEKLSASGLRDVRSFGKELADLRDQSMWGLNQDLQTKWVDLVSRIDDASRKADLVLAHNQQVGGLKRQFESVQNHFLDNVQPDLDKVPAGLQAMEQEFRTAVRKVHAETTTEDADRLAGLRKDAIDKGERLRRAVDIGVQAWQREAQSLSLRDTENKIELLAGWPGKNREASTLRDELQAMRATAVCTGNTDRGAMKAFQQRVDKTLRDWTDECRHGAAVRSFTAFDEATAHIKLTVELYERSSNDELSDSDEVVDERKLGEEKAMMAELRIAIDKWQDAVAKAMPNRPMSGTSALQLGDTGALLKNVKDAEANIQRVFEKGVGGQLPPAYLVARANDIVRDNQRLILRAQMIPDASDAVIELQHRVEAAQKAIKDPSLSGRQRYESALALVSTAEKLIDIGSKTVASAQTIGAVSSTTLHQQAVQLTEQVEAILTSSQSSTGASRADAIQKLVNAASDQMLAQLSDNTKVRLIEALVSPASLPASSKDNAADPLRMALRKMYAVTPLDPQFVKRDNALRERAVEYLVAEHGQEFLFYRENWSLMEQGQRMRALDQALEAHCKAMSISKPKLLLSNAQDFGGVGHYNKKTNEISICASNPGFADFESMIDTIFHENTHYYQNLLARSISHPLHDEFEMQSRIIAANTRGTNAYIAGTEDIVGYKRQPIEAHAWLAGSHATSLLMSRLDMLGTSSSGTV